MTQVFVVVGGFPCEGMDPISVHRERDTAMKAARAAAEERVSLMLPDFPLEFVENGFKVGSDEYVVLEMELQP